MTVYEIETVTQPPYGLLDADTHLRQTLAGVPGLAGFAYRDGLLVVVVERDDELTPAEQSLIANAAAGLTAWMLTADGATVDTAITISGMTDTYTYNIQFEGEIVASGADNATPYTLTFTPTAPGTYAISAYEQAGLNAGYLALEVT
jgi:hypothetical protein